MIRLAVALLALLPSLAHAQPRCGDRDAMAKQLVLQYHERQEIVLLSGPGPVTEIWLSARGEPSWTMLRTSPDGTACVVAAGGGYVRRGVEGQGIAWRPGE